MICENHPEVSDRAGPPPESTKASPLAPSIIASVAINGGIFTRVISTPLTAPMQTPASMGISTAVKGNSPLRFAARTAATAAIDPTERSIPPDSMTKAIPIETSPVRLTCRRMLARFSGVRNVGKNTVPTAQRTRNATRGPSDCIRPALSVLLTSNIGKFSTKISRSLP